MSEEPLIAVFVDFENLAIGVREMKAGKFQIQLVLKRLLEKGRIVYKRAYCDWRHYEDSMREFHAQGVEMIDIPQTKISGKNSADIRMVVDALDLCYSKQHIDTFALLSGDSDFSPLVSKLKENDRRVIGCGVKSSTSDLLIANCDEFIYYDDLIRKALHSRKLASKETPDDKKTPRPPRKEAPSPTRSTKPSSACWRSFIPWSRTTTPSGVRRSSRPFAAYIQASTKATTATTASPSCWKTSRARA